jgi:hypothetical protein
VRKTRVRVDVATHAELKRLAAQRGTTIGRIVSLGVRALGQDRAGDELQTGLRDDETAWLDANFSTVARENMPAAVRDALSRSNRRSYESAPETADTFWMQVVPWGDE